MGACGEGPSSPLAAGPTSSAWLRTAGRVVARRDRRTDIRVPRNVWKEGVAQLRQSPVHGSELRRVVDVGVDRDGGPGLDGLNVVGIRRIDAVVVLVLRLTEPREALERVGNGQSRLDCECLHCPPWLKGRSRGEVGSSHVTAYSLALEPAEERRNLGIHEPGADSVRADLP